MSPARLGALRNVLTIVGAYYVSAWVLVPIWIPIAKLTEGRVYSTAGERFGMELFNFLLPGATAVLAGIAAGLLLETERPLAWTVFAALFVGLMVWSSTHWHIRPAAFDLGVQALRAAAAAALTFFACRLAARRREIRAPA
jgi:hypothetical protein